MKTIVIRMHFRMMFLAITAAMIMTTSCKKEEKPVLDATTEEAANMVASSFCTGSAGTMTQIEDAVELSIASVSRSVLTDSSFTISSDPGAPVTYQYQVQYSYGFQTANSYLLTYTSNGDYSSSNLSADLTAGGSLNVTGFISGNEYVVNGQSSRTGNFTMKIGNKNSINGTISVVVTNFRFSKSTGLCTEGTAAVVVTGTTTTGRSLSFTGTLVYSGNYMATLTLSGKTYTVNITTGVVTEA